MEKNTFATSAYIANSLENTYEYLCSLKNLDEWTLYSRMAEQMDEDTWRGTASGYHRDLYYHVKNCNIRSFKVLSGIAGLSIRNIFKFIRFCFSLAITLSQGQMKKVCIFTG